MNNTNNATTTNTITIAYSQPCMSSEQFEQFQKECLWSDGWYSGRNAGLKQGAKSGLIMGLIVGGIVTATAIVATWMHKNNKQYRIDVTEVTTDEKEGDLQ